MRITRTQQAIITTGVSEFIGDSVEIQLFGSRLDDSLRGGGVELLLISPTAISPDDSEDLKMKLEEYLKLPVEIVAYTSTDKPTPSQAKVIAEALPLDTTESM